MGDTASSAPPLSPRPLTGLSVLMDKPYSFHPGESSDLNDSAPTRAQTKIAAAHVGSASFAFKTWGFDTKMTIWTGLVGLIANLGVATVLTLVLGRFARGQDETSPATMRWPRSGRSRSGGSRPQV